MTRGAPRSVREIPRPGPFPRYDVPEWSERFGLAAGVSGRSTEAGRGFDLGLWSDAPVGEVMTRWRRLRDGLPGFDAVVLGHQVHGTAVETVTGGRGWIQIEGVDGWVTTSRGVLLTVTIADCIPVYLAVPGRGVALLHAGWRGTAGGILEAGIRRLLSVTGGTAADIIMHCGVGICGMCYEVGSEVIAGCGLPADGPGPWHVDLRERLAAGAARLGLDELSVSTWCSAHDRPAFFSHRASRGGDGRMVAWLGMPRSD